MSVYKVEDLVYSAFLQDPSTTVKTAFQLAKQIGWDGLRKFISQHHLDVDSQLVVELETVAVQEEQSQKNTIGFGRRNSLESNGQFSPGKGDSVSPKIRPSLDFRDLVIQVKNS